MGLLYSAIRYFFKPARLNKGEKDQPPPLEEQRAHTLQELHRIDQEIRARREREIHRRMK